MFDADEGREVFLETFAEFAHSDAAGAKDLNSSFNIVFVKCIDRQRMNSHVVLPQLWKT